jgi:hypothetical protein
MTATMRGRRFCQCASVVGARVALDGASLPSDAVQLVQEERNEAGLQASETSLVPLFAAPDIGTRKGVAEGIDGLWANRRFRELGPENFV